MTQSERVALMARYLTALENARQARARFYAVQVDIYGADAVRTSYAFHDLVEVGITTYGGKNPNLGKWPTYPMITATALADLETLSRAEEQAEEALQEALAALRSAMEGNGYPAEGEISFDDVLAWAGADMETVEQLAGEIAVGSNQEAYIPPGHARGYDGG